MAVPESLSSATDPEWYFRSAGLEYYLGNLFDTPVEVHAFQLGLLVGVLFAIAVRTHRGVPAFTLGLLVAFLLGALDGTLVCTIRTTTCSHVQLKPWYFLTGVVAADAGVRGLARTLTRPSDAPESPEHG